LAILQRSHDHHRGLRARCHAAVSANSFNDRNQGRYLMTASQSRKSDCCARCLSIGHGRVRSDVQPSPQIVRRFTSIDVTRRSFVSRFTDGQLAELARPQSHTKSHSPRRHSRTPSRGFLPWRFADAGADIFRSSADNRHLGNRWALSGRECSHQIQYGEAPCPRQSRRRAGWKLVVFHVRAAGSRQKRPFHDRQHANALPRLQVLRYPNRVRQDFPDVRLSLCATNSSVRAGATIQHRGSKKIQERR
jgi:hypothetical protein